MIRIVECLTKEEFEKLRNLLPEGYTKRNLKINVETNMTDFDRIRLLRDKIELLMLPASINECVQISLIIQIIDSISGKKYEKYGMLYAYVKNVKEKYEKYNNDRNTNYLIKQLLGDSIKEVASFISISDAMEMLGIEKEESSKYLNEEGEYKYPDLIGKWASIFRGDKV